MGPPRDRSAVTNDRVHAPSHRLADPRGAFEVGKEQDVKEFGPSGPERGPFGPVIVLIGAAGFVVSCFLPFYEYPRNMTVSLYRLNVTPPILSLAAKIGGFITGEASRLCTTGRGCIWKELVTGSERVREPPARRSRSNSAATASALVASALSKASSEANRMLRNLDHVVILRH
jgi:hypothetical protein